MGITREISLLREAEIKHNRKNVGSPLSNINLNYNASNIAPHLNCVFTADILDYLNNSKTKDDSLFSKYSILD